MDLIKTQVTSREDSDSSSKSFRSCVEDSRHGSSSQNLQRGLKRDLPTFNNDDIDYWLFHLEEYMEMVDIAPEQRIKVDSLHMVGPAFSWYKWMVRNNITKDWFVLVEALQQRCGIDLYNNPQEALKENGTVAEYQNQFEALSTKVIGLTKQWLISFFVAGLDKYLKCQLQLAKLKTCLEAIALARLHKQNY